jgi:integrase
MPYEPHGRIMRHSHRAHAHSHFKGRTLCVTTSLSFGKKFIFRTSKRIASDPLPRDTKGLWQVYLEEEVMGRSHHTYTTAHTTRFLTSLCEEGLGSRTVAHVRSLLSGIFGHAVALGIIDANPVRDAKTLSKPEKSKPTSVYTLQEIADVILALEGDIYAQLAVALAAYAGLRPSEIAGLRWEDIHEDHIALCRSVCGGVASDSLKTVEAAAKVPLLSTLQTMVSSMSRGDGWVLCTEGERPVNMDEWSRRRIAEPLRKRGIRWGGLYAARRACASIVTALTGSPWPAQAILRHSNPSTTLQFYIKLDRETMAQQGMKRLEAELVSRKTLEAMNA